MQILLFTDQQGYVSDISSPLTAYTAFLPSLQTRANLPVAVVTNIVSSLIRRIRASRPICKVPGGPVGAWPLCLGLQS